MKKTIIIIFIIAFTSADVEAKIGLTMSGHSYLAKAKQQNYYQERKKTFNDLTFGIYNFGQKVKDTGLSKDALNLVISDEEIKQAMAFGTTEKITSIVAGALIGGYLLGSIGRLIEGADLHDPWGKTTIYSIGVGFFLGAFINYTIMQNLARRKAKKEIIESRKRNGLEGYLHFEMELFFSSTQPFSKNSISINKCYAGAILKLHL